ncbi:hypothetical protein GCM10022268_35300 [Sphingomonas cynarae]|uniref:Uncharacterized protein n=1 Tax=Sphingomonas cynarae TaxID=930197 RepID=A0ABP7ETH8_9SPHN
MQTISSPDRRRALAALIAESLSLADALGLGMVSLSLNGALEDLTGHGIPPAGYETAAH